MSTPAPAFLLVCPQCGKKYAGDPAKPTARYKCPADGAELAPESAKKTQPPTNDDAATRVITNDDDKTRVMSGTEEISGATLTSIGTLAEERRSVVAMFENGGSAPAPAERDGTKYETIGKLGQGGVGEVLKVIDRDLKREVAMKRLLPHSAQQEDALIRFIEEAQATGQLEHPNIVPVHDLGVDADGRLYFTLKYVQGQSLKQVLRGRKENSALEDGVTYRERFSAVRMIEILIAMCQAMAYAHSKGVIHRDLKPDNVMLGKFGEVLVMDWGLAKAIGQIRDKREHATDTVRVKTSRSEDDSSQTIEGSIAGTPAYMAPEQAAGKISELDQRTDVYALGAILYEMLSGEAPYRGGTPLELVKQVVASPPAPVKGTTPGFTPMPRELKAICEKAMARRPEDRYRTASELRDDLQAYLENETVTAAPDTAVQRAAKWIKRNRRQVKTSVVSAAAVVAVFLGVWYTWKALQIRSLDREAHALLEKGRAEHEQGLAYWVGDDSDVYSGQLKESVFGQVNRDFRATIESAMAPLRQALDLSPNNRYSRLLMAEAKMELWRLAIDENNPELAKIMRADVEQFTPDPALFRDELNGFGSLDITLEPATAEAHLFQYETLHPKDKDGIDLPPRLIPVPYDVKTQTADANFLKSETERDTNGVKLPGMEQRHSIFNLDAPAVASLGRGSIHVPQLAPGSYLLTLRAPGFAEIRVPFNMPRQGKITRTIALPAADELPPLFFYMAGGDMIVGGTTAGAPSQHVITLGPSLMFHDEITMAEYGAFLRALHQAGRHAEAVQRLPKDFGKTLATLNGAGELVPPKGSDTALFAQSPVRGVSYNDALAYVAWRSKQDGLPYRLPHDWEWEAGCRGADGRKYSWGDQPGKGLAVVTQGYGDTGAKMSWKWSDYKDESPWGMHNMAGGAAEWTDSMFDPNAQPTDPVYGQRTIRGNAWALPPVGLECAFRTSGQPDYFHPTIGFRLALDYPVKRIGTALVQAVGHVH